jgi:deazaflavin-dependent oxidoreductase (nitroreductase family)
MNNISTRPSWFQKYFMRFAYTRAGRWFFSLTATFFDRIFLRLTGGRYMLIHMLTGLPGCMLTTTGAKSGKPRSVPIVAIPVGEDYILIGSNFGEDRSPAWYYNLKANPEATITTASRQSQYLAREVTGQEYDVYWAKAVGTFPGYEAYRRWASRRHIPILLLTQKVS